VVASFKNGTAGKLAQAETHPTHAHTAKYRSGRVIKTIKNLANL
jgi:hypothetical protein